MKRVIPRASASVRLLGAIIAVVATMAASVPAAGQEQVEPSRRIGDAPDPVVAATLMARATFRDGQAQHVVIGRDDVFADSLAGAALAGAAGPVLFTTGGADASLRPEVRDELVRALGPPDACDGGAEVYLLGGTSAISTSVEEDVSQLGYCLERLAGGSRVETALRIADIVLARAGSATVPQVLLARADDWADAATGGAFAAAAGVPVLVTDRSALHPLVEAWLQEVQPTHIELLGGTAALSAAVEAAASPHGRVRRVAGSTREGTAAAIAQGLWGIRQGPRSTRPRGVMLVNGYQPDSWAYAIAAAVPAAVERRPQLYVPADRSQASRARYQWLDATIPLISAVALIGGLVVAGTDEDVPPDLVEELEVLAPEHQPLPGEVVAADLLQRVQDERAAHGLPPLAVHEGMTCISRESAAGGVDDDDVGRCGRWNSGVETYSQLLATGLNSQADAARIHVQSWQGPLADLALQPGFDLIGVGVACSADGRELYATYTVGRRADSSAPPIDQDHEGAPAPVRDDAPGATCDQL